MEQQPPTNISTPNDQPTSQIPPSSPNTPPPTKLPINRHTSRFIMTVLLFFFPPLAWYLMWKEPYYHKWLPGQLWFFGGSTIIFTGIILLFVYPQLQSLYSQLNIKNEPSILDSAPYLFLGFAVIEIIYGIYLQQKLKKQPTFSGRTLLAAALFLILHFATIVAVEIWTLSSIITPIYSITSDFNNVSPSQLRQTIPQAISDAQTEPKKTNNQKIYRDKQKRFEFRYPLAYTNSSSDSFNASTKTFNSLSVSVKDSPFTEYAYNSPAGVTHKYDTNKKTWNITDSSHRFTKANTSLEAYTIGLGDAGCYGDLIVIPSPNYDYVIEVSNSHCENIAEEDIKPAIKELSTEDFINNFTFTK